jgi:ParB family chromosome partitioning protein
MNFYRTPRKLASILAGCDTLPLIVREIDDDSATILVVDGNIQRETITFSEKAKAYKMKLDALRRQAGRPSKENAGQVDPNFDKRRSNVIVADKLAKVISRFTLYPPYRTCPNPTPDGRR